MCINNNAIINNYGRLQDLILLFKIPTATQQQKKNNSSKYLGTRPQEVSPALGYRNR